MTVLDSIPISRFSANELPVLQRIEGILSRHPYLRAELGGTGPLARDLESVLSLRLALLHTQGAAEVDPKTRALLVKLHRWEQQLANAASDEEGSEEALLRYQSTLLLHPEPGVRQSSPVGRVEMARITAAWEQLRANRPRRTLFTEKARQNRDFFRHGLMLPFYWLRRRRIRKLLPRALVDAPSFRETLFAIEQIGPIVDNFAFRGAAGVPISTSVALADAAFFYMQLADEFLDELAAAAGGHDAVGPWIESVYQEDRSRRPLFDFSLGHLRGLGVDPEAHATKFGVGLGDLFSALEQLGAMMDELLARAGDSISEATHLFLHHCFQTYLDEAALCRNAVGRRADRLELQDTGWHFYRKNNMVMMLWLDLRARLLGLEPAKHARAIRQWGYLLAAFQIFDDLKDIGLDLGNQPSYPLQIAANEFPEEFAWLEGRFEARRQPITRDEVPEVNLHARRTVQQCMRWSRLIALAHFDNTLLYAWDQRWRKSWTRRRSSFNPPGPTEHKGRGHAIDRLIWALLATRGVDDPRAVDDEELAFALDASAYEGSWQIYVALLPNLRAIYRFATLRMWMTAEEKARAARRLLRRYPRARASALVGLCDADVDHEVASDRLEAFSKLIEV